MIVNYTGGLPSDFVSFGLKFNQLVTVEASLQNIPTPQDLEWADVLVISGLERRQNVEWAVKLIDDFCDKKALRRKTVVLTK